MSEAFLKIKSRLGLVLLGAGLLFCFYVYFTTVRELTPPGRRTVLIAHWQGERGCREALQQVIDEYNKSHSDVYVRQQIIVGSGSSFVRWCVTQIIGGTPPDLMEYHGGFRSYLGNYFVGLGKYANTPNPYNQGTDVEGTPWKDTFYGGMRGCWEPELMDYYSIPNTMWTQRFYYNKDIFRKVTGSDAPPKTMAEFIAICKKIDEAGYMPVIVENAKGIQGQKFFGDIISQIGWEFEHKLDFNHDGIVANDEFLRAFYTKDFKLENPRLQAGMKLMREFSSVWGKGFNGIDFTVAPFMFIQQKGSCYLGGSWLGRQMIESCDFELGVFPIPVIGKDDPVAGKYYCGPWGENTTEASMALAVANGPNREDAIDFLRFLTTRKNNTIFNSGPAWVPGVMGAEINDAVKDFKPLIRGKNARLGIGTRSVSIELKRILQNFLAGDSSLDSSLRELEEVYRNSGLKDNLRSSRDSQRRLIKVEEIMDRAEQNLSASTNKEEKEELEKKIIGIYEARSYGLNPVRTVFGTSAEVK